ncbi:RDD family protein [Mesonia sp.]|uniref:RDD family protein n=1 Tax=Mesonia sp. TaxID=1960830 RepID=UPI00176FCEE7|nr:RDD family protein [Mesonia sp.]HIB37545.1 RDD family protein [Mesonia sp.]HIO27773.1 RDD family protein [Flavobacteriaceae bacterium]
MDNFQIETAQNVSIAQNIANLGDRVLAYIIDVLVIMAYIILTSILLGFISLGMREQWVYGLLVGLPPFLYPVLSETFFNGQSIGKALLRIRVVKLDGSKAAFSNFAIRWLLGLIELMMTSGAVALVVYLFNGKGQRLGDIAAKTTVISEKQRVFLHHTLNVEVKEDYQPEYPQVTIFKDREIQTIKNLFQKAKRESNHALIVSLSKKASEVMDVTPKEKPLKFVEKVIADYNFYTQQ